MGQAAVPRSGCPTRMEGCKSSLGCADRAWQLEGSGLFCSSSMFLTPLQVSKNFVAVHSQSTANDPDMLFSTVLTQLSDFRP